MSSVASCLGSCTVQGLSSLQQTEARGSVGFAGAGAAVEILEGSSACYLRGQEE